MTFIYPKTKDDPMGLGPKDGSASTGTDATPYQYEQNIFNPPNPGTYQIKTSGSLQPLFSWNEVENCMAKVLFYGHQLDPAKVFSILMQTKQELGLMPKNEGE